jgi:hypothetical protein
VPKPKVKYSTVVRPPWSAGFEAVPVELMRRCTIAIDAVNWIDS